MWTSNDCAETSKDAYKRQGQYGYNGSDYITLVPGATLENKKLKWEKTTTTNIGLDVSIFNSRVNLSVDWYNNESSNLVGYVPQVFRLDNLNRSLDIGDIILMEDAVMLERCV